ncbi:class III lanthionine synthetase LanKC [Janthinobacterium sp. B9-8]|uniref:class III lanthionine synthetase LanKC n=1 Tax=Janthinobacterium sp. B9-8 TaxID=1236179 RepID=UPI00061CEF67|nr:class III lanthionine synthetase LanKC [Janthinobacterium sp. B9-8]AMC34988.1 hypothetical protein VN23_10385 [Janthinobacterium sp. B9-8]
MTSLLKNTKNIDNDDFFVPTSAYKPSMSYYNSVLKLLPPMWRLSQGPFWTQILSPKAVLPVQGWKIHVSAIPESALRILGKVTMVCLDQGVEFKFASDPHILWTLLRKRCARQSAGKFITIYPSSQIIFEQLIERLYIALENEKGPYILSDRQYRDSSVLFYRYGGISSFSEVNVSGEKKMCILNDQFEYIEDHRSPYFVLPDFIKDGFIKQLPISAKNKQGDEENTDECLIIGEEYEIISVIKYSSAGGVYQAKSILSKEDVVIKEARPYIEIDNQGVDTIDRLKKEFRILKKISGTGISAEAIGFFEEWDHYFLVQAFLEGQNLRQFVVQSNKLIHATVSDSSMRQWFDNILKISTQLFEQIILLHKHDIVFGDLSLNNIIINPVTMEIKLIDFEGAVELGVDLATNMFSPGFGKRSRMSKVNIDFSDDFYALACFLMAMVLPNITLSELNDDFVNTALTELSKDIALPAEYINCIKYLMSDEKIDLSFCLEQLKNTKSDDIHGFNLNVGNINYIHHYCSKVVDGVFNYNFQIMDISKSERILPLGTNVYDPMAVDNGILGVAYAWKKVKGAIPDELNNWILRQFHTGGHLPGLLNGSSGMGWVLYELGHQKLAEDAIQAASLHRLLFQKMSLGYGAAGFGLSNLFLWTKTGKEKYKNEAIKIADIICDAAITQENGCSWDGTTNEGIGVGLWEGASGISLFLLYMYCVTKNERYLIFGENGLSFDMSCGREIEGTIGFPRHTVMANHVLYPYLAYGSAGVASVVLRYYKITKNKKYFDLIEKIKPAVSQKYTISPDLFSGLAGLGNYMLDANEFLNDASYLGLAYRVAEGLKLFLVEREQGYSFPLLTPTKICTDYSSGSAGIALFMNRLVKRDLNFNFMMDELIYEHLSSEHGDMPVAVCD